MMGEARNGSQTPLQELADWQSIYVHHNSIAYIDIILELTSRWPSDWSHFRMSCMHAYAVLYRAMNCGTMNPYGKRNFSEVEPSTYEAEPWVANFLHSLYTLKLMFGNQIWHDSGKGILRSDTPSPTGGIWGKSGIHAASVGTLQLARDKIYGLTVRYTNVDKIRTGNEIMNKNIQQDERPGNWVAAIEIC